jgi:S-adenosylmethionine:tRNA ribosyltransferase-isomerase
MTQDFSLSSYDYELPESLIAQNSVHPHHNSRLLSVDKATGEIISEWLFWDIDTVIPANRVLFFNNSKVLPARIDLENISYRDHQGMEKYLSSGEIFFLSLQSENTFEALVRPGSAFRVGTIFSLYGVDVEVVDISTSGRVLKISWSDPLSFFEHHGSLPLPPYIEYDKDKEKDYQSVFAEKVGSVAAPTASLHFTRELLAKLPHEKQYITLHVGLGTFQGIKTEDIRDFDIHEECIEIPKSIFDTIANIRNNGKYITPVGTTVCRSLESLPYLWKILPEEFKKTVDTSVRTFWDNLSTLDVPFVQAYTMSTRSIIFPTKIYIYPGYQFQIIEDIITNFHLPKSSLLVLISTLLWKDRTLDLYRYVITQWYRFFSFGDAMYIRWK